MTPEEIESLEKYFRKTFDLEEIEIKKRPRKKDSAEVYVKGKLAGVIDKDVEDGETAYQFEMDWKADKSKSDVKSLENHLRNTFGLEEIEVRKRAKKQDSVEVFVKEEFIGVIYKDEGDADVQFQMAILADDLNG
jgi:hypothetical protein